MLKSTRTVWGGTLLAAIAVALLVTATIDWPGPVVAQAAPPADQEYIGVKQCASCHFKQYMTWKKNKHAEAFEVLPAGHKTDPECLECHTTGYGEPTGYKGPSTPNLAGNTCENCHGPGSKHTEIAKQYADQELTPAQEEEVNGSIYLVKPNVCVDCHLAVSHQEHPEYEE